MAKLEHVEILKQGAKVLNQWRGEHPTTRLELENADLSYADLSAASLYSANLKHINLFNANLSNTDLRGSSLNSANFTHADLSNVRFDFAHFSHANLSHTNLFNVSFTHANLTGAALNFADLHITNLNETILKDTDWNNAYLDRTVFANVDLSDAQNLDTILHRGPSNISLDVLLNNYGKVPEIFWRGCGVDENLLRYLPALINQPIQFYSVFISYTHADKDFAQRLYDQLQGRGIRCWLDEHQINPGDNIFDEVDRGLKLWDKVLLCCSENSLKNHPWWVDNEINKAFVKEQTLQKQKGEKVLALIPLDLDGYLFQWQDGKADQVRSRLAADFKGWEKNNSIFEAQFERVVKALRTDGGKEKPPPQLLG